MFVNKKRFKRSLWAAPPWATAAKKFQGPFFTKAAVVYLTLALRLFWLIPFAFLKKNCATHLGPPRLVNCCWIRLFSPLLTICLDQFPHRSPAISLPPLRPSHSLADSNQLVEQAYYPASSRLAVSWQLSLPCSSRGRSHGTVCSRPATEPALWSREATSAFRPLLGSIGT